MISIRFFGGRASSSPPFADTSGRGGEVVGVEVGALTAEGS
jgi:hypothetical protein